MSSKKSLTIEFLYLDLDSCTRCQITNKSLKDSLEELKGALDDLGLDVEVKEIRVKNEKEAGKYQFVSSPTLRINGQDIETILYGEPRLRKSYCGSCSAICGEDKECRIFKYGGREYEYIPKAMIIEAINRVID